MAAKPFKPPGVFLNSTTTNNNNNNNNTTKESTKSATTNETISLSEVNNNNNNNSNNSKRNCSSENASACDSSHGAVLANKIVQDTEILSESETTSRIATGIGTTTTTTSTTAATTITPAIGIEKVSASASNCNCTNISIMHLFHEMKQEFPTIPDPIVAQCVNENCHQRENCIQVLRNEFALNPLTVQAYPAKVLQQQRQQQQQQQQQQHHRLLQSNNNNNNNNSKLQQHQLQPNGVKPRTPLKPTRSAPTTPSTLLATTGSNSNNNSNNNNRPKKTCDSVEAVQKSKSKDVQVDNCAGGSSSNSCSNFRDSAHAPVTAVAAVSDMPRIDATQPSLHSVGEAPTIPARCQQPQNHELPTSAAIPPPHPPRARPTTLNLQTHQQKQRQPQSPQTQRQLLNMQLQKYQQQRLQQQQQQLQQHHVKPLRKAPLPPIPPKPVQVAPPTPIFTQHSTPNGGRCDASLSNASSSTSLASPLSSCGESEISVNVSVSSPTSTSSASAVSLGAQSNRPLNSPIRHRSVITVQPEPPYTRDFLVASPTSSNASASQKSFTSVNLTLRQPSANSAAPQSTIDISAGPGLSGAGGGLTYSSTSYDARRGYQKNFHITVTDEGGVFSASRIRPRSAYAPGEQTELDGPATNDGIAVSPIRAASSEQSILQQQPTQSQPHPAQRLYQYSQQVQNNQQQLQQHQQQQHIVASPATETRREMCVPRKSSDDCSETLRRQRERRDRLASALRDNKRRLGHVEEEINILTEPVSPGASERLDSEIQRLRTDCEAMLNEIEHAKRCGPNLGPVRSGNKNALQPPQSPSFLRQRPPRPPLPMMGRLEFVQHPVTGTTTTPNSPILQHQTQSSVAQTASPASGAVAPPTYLQYIQQLQQQQQQQQVQQHASSDDDEDYADSNTDGGEDDEPLEMWACNMCTFRNHPQLNICECCENVRILPGTVRIVPAPSAVAVTASSAVVAATDVSSSSASASLENDANSLQQPQLALHT